MSTVRGALVAGQFYESDPDLLRSRIRDCFTHRLGPGELPECPGTQRNILGAVCPHAGVMYSGPQAARSFHRIKSDGAPDIIIILAPAHLVQGAEFAVWEEGEWQTPLGSVLVDAAVANALIASHPSIRADRLPHLGWRGRAEHAIEVQLPFLQTTYTDHMPSIVPIAVSCHNPTTLLHAGRAMGEATRDRDVVFLASCDFSHYESHEDATRADAQALERIAELDADGLLRCVARHPSQSDTLVAVAMVAACKALGATRGEVLGYSTSGDIIGEYDQVVGYGSAVVLKRG